MFNNILGLSLKKIATLFKIKYVYFTIAFIAILIFLLSVVQNNTILESIIRAFSGTVISAIIITIMWIVIYNIVGPLMPNVKKDNDLDLSSVSDNKTPTPNSEIAISDDNLDMNDILNTQPQNLDSSNDDSFYESPKEDIIADLLADNHYNMEEPYQKSTLNEEKEVDNSNELLYHETAAKTEEPRDYDVESIDSIIFSNNAGDSSKNDREEILDVNKLVDESNLKSTDSNKGSNFEDFSNNPELSAQLIRTVRAKDEGKGNT